MGKLSAAKEFETGTTFEVGDLQIRSFRISHDTNDPVGYVISNGKASLGYLTDTGKVSHLMLQRLTNCKGLILEFNHNLEMLKNGPYPLELQQRVRSSRGHLSNEDAAAFLGQLLSEKLRLVVLAHLSEINNSPELAMRAAEAIVGQNEAIQLRLSTQAQATPLVEITTSS